MKLRLLEPHFLITIIPLFFRGGPLLAAWLSSPRPALGLPIPERDGITPPIGTAAIHGQSPAYSNRNRSIGQHGCLRLLNQE